jgi:hypothetical protein
VFHRKVKRKKRVSDHSQIKHKGMFMKKVYQIKRVFVKKRVRIARKSFVNVEANAGLAWELDFKGDENE